MYMGRKLPSSSAGREPLSQRSQLTEWSLLDQMQARLKDTAPENSSLYQNYQNNEQAAKSNQK